MTEFLLILSVMLGVFALFVLSLLLRSRNGNPSGQTHTCATCGCGRQVGKIALSRQFHTHRDETKKRPVDCGCARAETQNHNR